jgi:hypothetical protein
MSAPRCADCRFVKANDERFSSAYGACRRYAPRPEFADVQNYTWPQVHLENDWCGEFSFAGDEIPAHVESREDPIAEVGQWIKDRVGLCGHGVIQVTCGSCMANWLPR